MSAPIPSMIVMLVVALGVGCNRKEEKPPLVKATNPVVQRNEPLEIFTWWNGPGEDAAYQAFIDVFNKQFPSILLKDISKIPAHGDSAKEELTWRMAKKRPPDSFQVYPFMLAQFLTSKEQSIESLDALYTLKYWGPKFRKAAVDSVSRDGHIYAVPIGIHRRNTMFCNPELVPVPPKDLEAFFTQAKALKAAGTDALVVTIKDADWPLMLLFNSVMAASAGIPFFKDFYEGELSTDSPSVSRTLEKAVADFAKMLHFANTDGAALNWQDGARRVMEKKAAMYIYGDWVSGYYRALGWTPSVAPAPGTEGLFAFNVDAFSLCADAPHPENARRFLSTVGSVEAQAAFNRLKGSLPARNDVSVQGWGPIAEATDAAYRSARLVFNVDRKLFIGLPESLHAFYDKKMTEKNLLSWILAHYKTDLVPYDSPRLRSDE